MVFYSSIVPLDEGRYQLNGYKRIDGAEDTSKFVEARDEVCSIFQNQINDLNEQIKLIPTVGL
jgi:hypothetical protein